MSLQLSARPTLIDRVVPRSLSTDIALIFAGAVLTAIAAQIAIPMWPVPITGQTFAVLLVGASLGSLRGALSMVVYLIAGMVGVPWFAEGSSGFSSASFGYVLGFIVAAFIVGRLAERGASTTALRSAGLMVIGNLAIYAVGVTWLKFAIDVDWATALSLGVVPFLIGDAVKIALAAGLLPLAWKGLEKMQLRNN